MKFLEADQPSLFPVTKLQSEWDMLWDIYEFPEPTVGDIIAIGCCAAEFLEPEDPEDAYSYVYWQLCSIAEIRDDGKVICKFDYNFSPENEWFYENILGKKILLDKEDICIPFPQVEYLLDLHEKREISIRTEYRDAMLRWKN